ncbi:hypothetical protein [Neogemmobacter tilapiae]|nr:hypothetical protein [Gemmobacter tilapiae]
MGLVVAAVCAGGAGWFSMPGNQVGTRPVLEQPTPIKVKTDETLFPTPVAAQLDQYIADFSDQLLFAEGRQAPNLPEVVEAEDVVEVIETIEEPIEEAVEQPVLQLLGILATGEQTRALLRNDALDTEIWVTVGDDVHGWTVVAISQNDVRLEQPPHEFAVQLYRE